MKDFVCLDWHLFLLAEGRYDILTAQSSVRSVALAAAVWDMLDAGILWGIPGKSFTAARPLPEKLEMLQPVYTLIAKGQATRPNLLCEAFFSEEDPPAKALSKAVIHHLITTNQLNRKTLEVTPVARAELIKRVRSAALDPMPSSTDTALLVALDRSTFLRDGYFHGKGEELHLSHRLRNLQNKPPLAAGWSMPELLRQFFLYDQGRTHDKL